MTKHFLHNPIMDILSKSLDAASLRQKAISNNIANLNTPNYKRQLVSFEEEISKCLNKADSSISLKRTKPGHIALERDNISKIEPVVFSDKSSSLRTDGNNVDIDLELAILAENTVKFNVLSQTISKKFSMLRSVIRGGR